MFGEGRGGDGERESTMYPDEFELYIIASKQRWLGHVESKTALGGCSTEKSEWTPKDVRTKTEVERCCTKIHEGERDTERRRAGLEIIENENSMRRLQIGKCQKRRRWGHPLKKKLFWQLIDALRCVPCWQRQ